MLRTRSTRATFVLAVLALTPLAVFTAPPLGAQSTTVTLEGTITGSDGSAPGAAQVRIQSRETNASRVALADSAGEYRVLGLAPGTYDVAVRAIGYRQQRREGVRLVVGQRATFDFTLELGAVELEPTVVTAERAFELQRTDVSTAVLQEEIEKLPLNTRNVLNLAAIAPGIRTFAPEAGRTIPNAGAIPGVRFTNVYVDGLEWKGTYIGNALAQPGIGSLIPQEAVREFRVSLNPYDAEYTRGTSWVISAVTHQGGNNLEGSIFAFHQNKALVAKGAFQADEPDYQRRQLGGNVRGPLVRDRLFFSLSYEGLLTDDYFTVTPGRPEADPGKWDDYAVTARAPLRVHGGLLRLTAPLGSHTVDAIWATRHIANESGFGTHIAGVLQSRDAGISSHIRLNSIQLRDTYASRSLVNELSLHALLNTNDEFPLTPGPTFQYRGSIQLGQNRYPVLIDTRHLRATNKTSYALNGPAGRHLLKSGVEVNRVHLGVYRPTNKDGFFFFETDTSSWPSRAMIGVSIDSGSAREAWAPNDGWIIGGYLQDEWQPTPTLTITAGIRYDAEINTLNQDLVTTWATDTTLIRAVGEEFLNTGDRRNDLDNVAPRLAVAWDVLGRGRTFARAGYGVMYDRVPIFGAVDERITVGWRTYQFPSPGTTEPAELRRRVATGLGRSMPNLVLLKDRLETPANHQWSVGVGHQLSDHVAANLDYVHQRVRNAYVSINANWLDAVTSQRAISNRFGNVLLWDDIGDARFQALLASLTYDRRPTRLNVAYTLSWAKSEFGELTTSDYPNRASYTMQRSAGDERHRLVVSGFTSLPYGIDLSTIATVASPRPFLVTTGSDDNLNTDENDDWPNGVRTHRRTGWDHWYRTIDLRLGKWFAAPHGRVAVTAEAFNLLNWANHSEYRPSQDFADYGEPVGDYARRQAQLGVRYQF